MENTTRYIRGQRTSTSAMILFAVIVLAAFTAVSISSVCAADDSKAVTVSDDGTDIVSLTVTWANGMTYTWMSSVKGDFVIGGFTEEPTVTIGGTPYTGYTWSSGTVRIPASDLTGDVEISERVPNSQC